MLGQTLLMFLALPLICISLHEEGKPYSLFFSCSWYYVIKMANTAIKSIIKVTYKLDRVKKVGLNSWY